MRLPVLAAILATAAVAAPASAAVRTFPLGAYDAIEAAGPFTVDVHTGKPTGARAVGSQKALDRLEIEIRNRTLYIGTKRGMSGFWGDDLGKVTITVGAGKLEAAALTGSGDLTIDHVTGPTFDLALRGSGSASLPHVATGKLGLALTGSGDATLAGRAETVAINLRGSGDIGAKRLMTRTAAISLMGSGDIDLGASGSAVVNLMGSGDVTINGGARCTVNRKGSGEVHC
ncbi:DUF2807 domain-containing protein [Sphingomonas naphthae]|uniref:DUF2807 domain-containing protein n=1 Tax=Sphingomonas naphthae TaxID=1813468 RepID=A0ABY7TKL5_9SPHN|nr:head GIN domain-containing protein [Sphingomonas naphthae]WCT73762.1 DUF2807 domain-containing protein [Sphingomonas naphthae]